MGRRGFTLVELMVVVVIIGILVAIIIPIYGSVQDRAAIKTHEANLRTIDGAIAMYISEHGGGPEPTGEAGAIEELITKGFLTERPSVPKRLLGDQGNFTESYSSVIKLCMDGSRPIENLYYEVYELNGSKKAFPTLIVGDYRVNEEPEDIYTDLLRTYVFEGGG